MESPAELRRLTWRKGKFIMGDNEMQKAADTGKSIIFTTDRKSKNILGRREFILSNVLVVDYYDDLMKIVKGGSSWEIITPLAAALSPEIRQYGYRQYIARDGKPLELKEGFLEECGIELKDYQDFLKMFLNGDFDSYWE